MSEGSYGTDNLDGRKLWEVTRPQEQVGQVGGDVQGRIGVRPHVGDVTSGPLEPCHL
jgi:hypothetical protein